MNHVCVNAGVMRLKSAGCLTCESEDAARATPTAVIPGRADRREPGIQFESES
jgi:hypothetical protein